MNSELTPAPRVADTATSRTYDAVSPTVSVVVSTFRRSHMLPKLLERLEEQDMGRESFEIVIADNASPDDTWPCLQGWVATTPVAARVVRVAENTGPSSGRNAAIGAARGEYAVFTDDDCLPEPDWLREMLRALADGHGIVQGRTEPPRGQTAGTWDRALDIQTVTHLFEMCNLGFRRADLVAVGGLRALSRYRGGRDGLPFGGEDTLLGWSVVRARGAEVTFASGARVRHPIEFRSFADWLAVRRRVAVFPALLAEVPELREHFFLRWFFSSRSAAFDVCGAGVVLALALRSWVPVVAALPYLRALRPRRSTGLRAWIATTPRTALGDAVTCWHLVRGSFQARRVLL